MFLKLQVFCSQCRHILYFLEVHSYHSSVIQEDQLKASATNKWSRRSSQVSWLSIECFKVLWVLLLLFITLLASFLSFLLSLLPPGHFRGLRSSQFWNGTGEFDNRMTGLENDHAGLCQQWRDYPGGLVSEMSWWYSLVDNDLSLAYLMSLIDSITFC